MNPFIRACDGNLESEIITTPNTVPRLQEELGPWPPCRSTMWVELLSRAADSE